MVKGAAPARLRGEKTAKFGTALQQVFHFGAGCRWTVKSQFRDMIIRERQVETVAELFECIHFEFFLLVRRHLRFARLAHPIALLGLRQNDRGLALVAHRNMKGCIKLSEIMATALERADCLERHMGNEFAKLGIKIKKCSLL